MLPRSRFLRGELRSRIDQARKLLVPGVPATDSGVQGVSARPRVAHYIQNLHLVNVLDELRDAYEICKQEGHPKLQFLLLQTRRKLLEALHESLNLYGENAELHQQLSDAEGEIRRLRASLAHPSVTVESSHTTRKLS
ncbi:MAG: hypothetical protein ACREV7_21115 [Steroidobacteraceae bacterium]